MSLITLNSSGSRPEYFSSYLPQPIKIKPYSQVCLMKFLHFRDGGVYTITGANNTFFYCIGGLAAQPSKANNAVRRVVLSSGVYSGAELALEIQTKMNGVNQQQNFTFTCAFVDDDPTTSPPTVANFTISFASVAKPAAGSVAYSIDPANTSLTPEFDVGVTNLTPTTTGEIDAVHTRGVGVSTDGIRTHLGNYRIRDIPLDSSGFVDADPATSDANFSRQTYGVCRDLLSTLVDTGGNANKQFSEALQDVTIQLGVDGSENELRVGSILGQAGTRWGQPNYVTPTVQRSINLKPVVAALLTSSAALEQWCDFRLGFVLTTTQTAAGRCICQVEYSLDAGATYQFVTAGTGGNDAATGEPYFVDFKKAAPAGDDIEYPGTFWVSGVATFQNQGQTIRQTLLKTKNAPFHPTACFTGVQRFAYQPDLPNAPANFRVQGGGTPDFDIEPSTSIHGYTIKGTVAGGGKTYFFLPSLGKEGRTLAGAKSAVKWYINENDVAATDANTGSCIYSYHTTNVGGFTITEQGGATVIVNETANKLAAMEDVGKGADDYPPIIISSIKNAANNPVALDYQIQGSDQVFDQETIAELIADTLPPPQADDPATQSHAQAAGDDLSTKIILYTGRIDQVDLGNPANQGSPAYLDTNVHNGQLSGTLGLLRGVFVMPTAASTGQLVQSVVETQRISRDNVLMVSIPELSGLKSYQGIDRMIGKHLSGEAKVLAVLPREEFRESDSNGHLCYIAPFENWLDINNAQELVLNQLTIEVRILSGELADDYTLSGSSYTYGTDAKSKRTSGITPRCYWNNGADTFQRHKYSRFLKSDF